MNEKLNQFIKERDRSGKLIKSIVEKQDNIETIPFVVRNILVIYKLKLKHGDSFYFDSITELITKNFPNITKNNINVKTKRFLDQLTKVNLLKVSKAKEDKRKSIYSFTDECQNIFKELENKF